MLALNTLQIAILAFPNLNNLVLALKAAENSDRALGEAKMLCQ
jgi:hypothetical protein